MRINVAARTLSENPGHQNLLGFDMRALTSDSHGTGLVMAYTPSCHLFVSCNGQRNAVHKRLSLAVNKLIKFESIKSNSKYFVHLSVHAQPSHTTQAYVLKQQQTAQSDTYPTHLIYTANWCSTSRKPRGRSGDRDSLETFCNEKA